MGERLPLNGTYEEPQQAAAHLRSDAIHGSLLAISNLPKSEHYEVYQTTFNIIPFQTTYLVELYSRAHTYISIL